DPPPAAVFHPAEAGLGHVEAAAEVDPQYLGPVVVGHLEQGAVAGDTGIVHQDVGRADFLLDLSAAREAGLVVADVPLVGPDPGLGGEGAGPFLVAGVVGRHGYALVAQGLANGPADSP